ncbi:MAG TPA: MFS transporter [Polyangia bacterium]|nr:MFS transporter [Polyangia bacterium]
MVSGGRPPSPAVVPGGRWVLAATILGSSLSFIDGTVVNVALPVLQQKLQASAAQTQWVVESYTLLLSAFLLVGGALGDRLGRKRVFAVGVSIFAVASMLCGISPDANVLIAARALQGFGAALLMPGSLAIISAHFGEHGRGRAIGTWSGFTAITTASGPVLGGWLVQHASFRWIFFINIPIAVAVLILTRWKVVESRDPQATGPLDWSGAALAAAGLGALVYGLIAFPSPAHRTWSIGAVALGGVLLLAFGKVEQTKTSPMLPLSLFRSKAFLGANLLTLFLYAALGGMLFFWPFMLIGVQGYAPAAAGAAMLPFVVILFVLSRWSGALADRYGARRPLIVGPAIAGVGFLLFALPGLHGSYASTYLLPAVVLGLGMAISVAPLTTVVMSSVPEGRAGVASAVNNAVARTAGLLAIAVLGVVVSLVFSHALRGQLIGHLPEDVVRLVWSQRERLIDIDLSALPENLRPTTHEIVGRAYLQGFRATALISAALAWTSAVISATMLKS